MDEKENKTHAEIIAEQLSNIESLGDELPAVIAAGSLRKLLRHLAAAHKREVDNLNSVIQATVSRSDAEIDRLRRELSKTRPKNGGHLGQFDAEALRDALKEIEATVTAALAHQPEDEAKCGQFLYDALVKCFNLADLACHAARTESGAVVSRAAATAENSSEVGNAAKLREALETTIEALCKRCKENECKVWRTQDACEAYRKARAALAEPPRNCDVGTAEEQSRRMHEFCDSHGHGFDGQKCYSCENCRFISIDRCELAWAQLPYESEAASPLPRPATEQEIEDGKAKWCHACATDCPDKGKDLLCVCVRFKKESEAADGK